MTVIRLALFESIFVGIYILDIHLRTYLQSTTSILQSLLSFELNGDQVHFALLSLLLL